MNQGDEIISKAEAMGINTGSSSNIDDRLKVIASEVGLHTFDPNTDKEKLKNLVDEKYHDYQSRESNNAYNRRMASSESATLATTTRANNMIPSNGMLDIKETNEAENLVDNGEAEQEENTSNIENNVNEEAESSSEEKNQNQKAKGDLAGMGLSALMKLALKHPYVLIPILIILAVLILILFIVVIVSANGSFDGSTSGSTSGGSMSYSSSNATVTDSCEQISMPIDEFLASKGTSLEEYNNYIFSEVTKAGVGTREGVVAAAVSLVGGLCQKYQARLPYTMGGAHPANFYGIPTSAPNSCGSVGIWGSSINGGSGSMMCGYGPYFYSGPDCSGFVSWAIHNGGYKYEGLVASGFGSLGTTHSMSSFTGKPGDVLYNSGHVVLIVGEDGDNYIIAEASSGENGTRITKEPKTSGRYTVVDMESYYNNDANKISDYPQVSVNNTGDDTSDSSDNDSEQTDENNEQPLEASTNE